MKPKTSDIWQYFVEIDEDHAKCKTCHKNYSKKGRTTTSLKGHLKSMHKEEYEVFCKMDGQRDVVVNLNPIQPTATPLQQATKPKTSGIWQYFEEIDENYAKCKTCNKNYSRKGRTTTSLKGHLKSMHKEKYEEFCELEEQREIVKLNQTQLQQAKKEMAKEESIKKYQIWDTSHVKAKKMDDLIGEMIALQNLPVNFVEGIGFRRVMQTALPNYQLRGRQFFTDHICDEIYPKMARKIAKMLEQFPKLSFTTNILSEPCANESLLSLTAHGITEDFTRIQIVLKCRSPYGRHTGDIICDHFRMMLLEWDIQDEQIHCFIRDGGSNMVRTMHLACNIPDVNCTVHQLQLCVRSALENSEMKDLIAKCKRISEHFDHSQIAQDELIEIQTEQLNQPELHVIQDCVTRWNSPFNMIERLLKIKESICVYAINHNIPQISSAEWLFLNKIVAILNPFEGIMRNLSDTTACISSVIPLIHVLKHTLDTEKEKSDTSLDFKNMIKNLIKDINSKFCDLPSNTLYSLATYLDPRYKLKFFNEIIKKQVQSELLRLLTLHNLASGVNDGGASAPKRTRIKYSPKDDEPSTSFQSLPPTQSVHSNLANLLNSSSDDEENIENDNTVTNSNLVIWKSLINEYNKENLLQLNEDPLMWWRYNTKFQVFSPIARTYLSSPPASVPCDQLFSGADLNNEPLRNRLEGDKAAKLLFVKYNFPLLNFDCK